MTPKQRVLKKYPKAYAYAWAGPGWVIYVPRERMGGSQCLNLSASTPQKAWQEAAERVKKGLVPYG